MQNHRLNGQGTLTYDNGDTYTGEFKNGSFNGQGTFKSHEGWIIKVSSSLAKPMDKEID